MHSTISDFTGRVDVSRETLAQLQVYAELLAKWQPAQNLISNSTVDDMWRRHFLDSAQMYAPIRARYGDKELNFMDIGSGAGFPGLVLSIMGLGKAHMVESNNKKCIFMGHVSRDASADSVILNKRIEELDDFPLDFITSRACATISQLLDWSGKFIKPHTELWLLKGTIVDDELTEALKSWNMKSERYPSLSDETGCILRLYDIKKK